MIVTIVVPLSISSVHEQIPQTESVPYTVSKWEMIELTRNVAFEMADKCIRINAIAQGAIATDINKDTLDDLQKKKQEEQVIQIHRIAQPQEVVKVALFLV